MLLLRTAQGFEIEAGLLFGHAVFLLRVVLVDWPQGSSLYVSVILTTLARILTLVPGVTLRSQYVSLRPPRVRHGLTTCSWRTLESKLSDSTGSLQRWEDSEGRCQPPPE